MPTETACSASRAGRAEVNCVRFHIPYDQLGDEPERDYFPTAWAIARFLGWRLFDQQLGEYIVEGTTPAPDRGASQSRCGGHWAWIVRARLTKRFSGPRRRGR